MQFVRIKNWDKYQHYKDRNPKWIKLYQDLLTSQAWVTGNDASRALAVACMLLASKTGNRIPLDPVYLRRVAYLNDGPDFSQLVASDFLEIINENGSASTMLAECYQSARPEKSRGEEKRKVAALPDWLPEEPWKAWLEVRAKNKAPNTPRALNLAMRELDRLRGNGEDPVAVLEMATMRGWRGLFPIKSADAAPKIKVDL